MNKQLALGVLVLLVACSPVRDTAPPRPHEAEPVPPGTLAFGRDPSGFDFIEEGPDDGDLFLLLPDGTRKQITDAPDNDFSPTFSPDRTQLAFRSDRTGNHDIYVMGVDGAPAENITDSPAEDRSPAWSPNGNRIAFASAGDDGLQIYVMDADGSNMTKLTDFDSGEGAEYPAWSPDGSRIAFHAFVNRGPQLDSEIFVMNADGSDLTQLTDNAFGEDRYPTWSPDGEWIAYSSSERGNVDIYAIALGWHLPGKRLTTHPGSDYSPNWSEHGIVFTRGTEEHFQRLSDLWVMTSSGRNERRVVTGGGNVTPSWAD